MDEKQPVLSVDFKKEFSTLTDGVVESLRVCVDSKAIQAGLIKELGANRFSLLMAIVSYMDVDGKAFPSQRKLADLTGQSPTTVNKNINEMLEITFNGQHILRRELTGAGKRQKSLYYIHKGEVTNTDAVEETAAKPVKQAANSEGGRVEVTVKKWTSRDVAHYFAGVYEETFGQGYVINYQRELKGIKDKLLPNYDEKTLKGVIDVAVKDYQKRWGSVQYPLPTISMLTSWLANKAFAIYKQGADREQQIEQKIEKAKAQDDTDRALSLFDV